MEVLKTLGGIITFCQNFYFKNKLKKASGLRAKELAETLYDVKESIREAGTSEYEKELSKIIESISTDVNKIYEHVSAINGQILKKRRGLLTLLEADEIDAHLRHADQLAAVCKGRLETAHLFILQARKQDNFVVELQNLRAAVLTRDDIDEFVLKAFEKLDIQKLLPTFKFSGCSSEEASSVSVDLDSAERQSIGAIADVPSAIQDLTLLASKDRIKSESLKQIIENLINSWGGWYIKDEDIEVQWRRPLGSGGFGTVYSGTYRRRNDNGVDSHAVAVKQIAVEDCTVLAEVIREALLHMIIQHHCIIRCFGLCPPPSATTIAEVQRQVESGEEPDGLALSIITEKMSCNLADALKGRKSNMQITSDEDKSKIVRDVADAVKFLHSKNIVHRDIKPENILLEFENGALVGYAKLADFGNSRRAHVEQTTKISMAISAVHGTPLFMPPEVLIDVFNCRTTKAWDVWSYGVLLCYVFAHQHTPKINSMQIQKLAEERTLSLTLLSWAQKIENEDVREAAIKCLDASGRKRTVLHAPHDKDLKQMKAVQYFVDSLRIEDESAKEQLKQVVRSEGYTAALRQLRQSYKAGDGLDKNISKTIELFEKSTDLEDATAMCSLGFCYQNGDGVAKDFVRAGELYQKAADLGNTQAIFNLGYLFANGIGVTKDMVRAAELYQMGADLGHASSILNLGFCYQNGVGVTKDLVRAAELYQKAADLGSPQAIFNLGYLFANGMGVSKDMVRATELYQKGADLGHAESINSLGTCYKNGTGVSKDLVRAAELYQRAADLGEHYAISNLGVLWALRKTWREHCDSTRRR